MSESASDVVLAIGLVVLLAVVVRAFFQSVMPSKDK